jgi:hypothetical protein
VTLQFHVPYPQIWARREILVKVLSLIISDYVLNQSWGHWLFLDALQFVILTCWDIHEDLAFQLFLTTLWKNFFLSQVKGACGSHEATNFGGSSTLFFPSYMHFI